MLFEVNKNGRSATSGVGAKAVSTSAVKHNAGRDAVFNATLNANIIKVYSHSVQFFCCVFDKLQQNELTLT